MMKKRLLLLLLPTLLCSCGPGGVAAVLLAYMQDDDLRAVAKLKMRHAPHLLTDEEKRLLQQRSLAEKIWRWARSYLRPWLQERADPTRNAGEGGR